MLRDHRAGCRDMRAYTRRRTWNACVREAGMIGTSDRLASDADFREIASVSLADPRSAEIVRTKVGCGVTADAFWLTSVRRCPPTSVVEVPRNAFNR
jgi:hypothetical protein